MKTTIYTKLFNVKQAGIKLQRNTKAFNYKYASLDQIQEKLWDVFTQEKLLIIHSIRDDKVLTQIFDIESWEAVFSEIAMNTVAKAQDKGSEITYFRRYNLLSLLDLEVEDDDWKAAKYVKPKPKVVAKQTMVKENYAKFQENLAEWIFDWKDIEGVITNSKVKYDISVYEKIMREDLAARKLIS